MFHICLIYHLQAAQTASPNKLKCPNCPASTTNIFYILVSVVPNTCCRNKKSEETQFILLIFEGNFSLNECICLDDKLPIRQCSSVCTLSVLITELLMPCCLHSLQICTAIQSFAKREQTGGRARLLFPSSSILIY